MTLLIGGRSELFALLKAKSPLAWALCLVMVVGTDPRSIPSSWKHANTRSDPAEDCRKVLAPAAPSPPAAIFRIFPILSKGLIECRILNLNGR